VFIFLSLISSPALSGCQERAGLNQFFYSLKRISNSLMWKELEQAYLSLFSCQRTKKFAINTNKTIPKSFRALFAWAPRINFVLFYLLQGNTTEKILPCQHLVQMLLISSVILNKTINYLF